MGALNLAGARFKLELEDVSLALLATCFGAEESIRPTVLSVGIL